MDFRDRISRWEGRVYRHIPTGSAFGPLEKRFAARSREHRWNDAGEPTLYFGSDRGVLITEFGRHLREARDPDQKTDSQSRQIFAIDVNVEYAFDLRDSETLIWLGVDDVPACFLDRAVTRALAGHARHVLQVEALIVPSVAFLDDPTRWNLVLFLEQLRRPLVEVAYSASGAGTFRLDDPANHTAKDRSAGNG